MRKVFITFLILLIGITPIYASPQFTTAISNSKVGVNDLVQVSYTITGLTRIDNVSVPSIENFDIVNQQQNTINDQTQFILTLKPYKTGTFIIPGAILKSGKNTYRSNNVKLTVVNGSVLNNNKQRSTRRNNRSNVEPDDFDKMVEEAFGDMGRDMQKQMEEMMRQQREAFEEMRRNRQRMAPSYQENIGTRDNNIFIRATTNKRSVYVGEPITISYNLYYRVAFQGGQITKLPALNNFYSQDYDIPQPPQEEIVTLGGVRYASYLIKKSILYPTQSGEQQLDPMELQANTQRYGTIKIQSDPITINVKPLPKRTDGKSISAVGNYNIKSQIAKTTITTNDIGSLQLTISGYGNLDMIQAPKVTWPNDLIGEEPTVSLNSGKVGEGGSKTFTYNFSPAKAGTYEIPAIPFSYFDPEKGSYIDVKTQPTIITIDEGGIFATKQQAKNKKVGVLQGIDNDSLANPKKQQPFAGSILYWSLLGLLIATTPLMAMAKKQQHKVQNNPLKQANKVAMARLSKAQSLLNHENPALFYEEISKSVWLYLSDKLHIPLSDLNKQILQSQLQEKQVPNEMIQQTNHIINECEIALYSGMTAMEQKDSILKNAIDLISNYEQIFTVKK